MNRPGFVGEIKMWEDRNMDKAKRFSREVKERAV